MINGATVLLDQSKSGVTVINNATVSNGWNTFELRLGQGSGSVGNNNTGFPNMGVGYDRMGRGAAVYANYKTLSDPGDGSLLTLTNSFDLANANLLPTNSAVTVAADALLDLGGTGQKAGGVNGSGTVSNGTLTVNGTIAPGGLNALGTLTLATSSSTLSGSLRVDVSSDGTCDVLAVKGDVSVSGLAVYVDNPDQLNTHLVYTILTCTGARSGTLDAKNLPSGWRVISYEPNGDVNLKFHGGSVIRVY